MHVSKPAQHSAVKLSGRQAVVVGGRMGGGVGGGAGCGRLTPVIPALWEAEGRWIPPDGAIALQRGQQERKLRPKQQQQQER